MSEYLHVEKPFLDQLAALDWTVIDQGQGFIPSDPTASLRDTFREWLLPEVFRDAVRAKTQPLINIESAIANMALIDAILKTAGVALPYPDKIKIK